MRLHEITTADWLVQQREKLARRPAYQAELLSQEHRFFATIVANLLRITPDAEEIWLHGSRAIGEHRRTSDWDFVVFLPSLTPERRVELHARGGGFDFERLAGRKVDVQAEDITRNDDFIRVVRDEGMRIWAKNSPQPA